MEIGSEIGPYRIDALLGQGGMAEVYRAWHLNLHCNHAIKVLPAQMTFDQSLVARFLDEARKMAGLQHPNIAVVHNVSEAGCAQPYFAMELVVGGDLSDLLAGAGAMPLNEAVPILEQIGAALDYAHGRGLIHRDVKPANVLLKNDGHGRVVKVVDFGIARAQEETGGKRLTKTGMIVGTPEYMSPEQGGSGPVVDHRTDQYSLAVIAYEMLCGTPPFKSESESSMLSVIMQHVRDEPRPPIDRIPGLSRAANAAILKALSKDPADRFENCGAFLSALQGSQVVKIGGPKKPKPIGNTATKPKGKFPLAPVALGLVAFAGAGLIGYGLNSSNSGPDPTPTPTSTTAPPPEPSPSPTPAKDTSVPDVVGMTEAQARDSIEIRNLVPQIVTGYSDTVAVQKVMWQIPAKKTAAAKGAPVKIGISLGPKLTPRPSPIPTNVPSAETGAILSALDNWERAWESQDVGSYMNNYSSDATIFGNNKTYTYNEYYQHEAELFSNRATIEITRRPEQINVYGDTAEISFPMTFQRWGGKGNYKSRGLQKFTMRKINGSWLIANDHFTKY